MGQDCGVLRVCVEGIVWFAAAEIFDVSRLSLFYIPTIVMQICKFDSVIRITAGSE